MKIIKWLLISLLIASCGAADAVSWSYEGQTGPQHWGDLTNNYALCKTGVQQSPINIMTKSVDIKNLPAMQTDLNPSMGEIVNNGHTIQVNLNHGGNATLGDHEYTLLQFHFHTPSENTLDGKHFPLEGHLVFKNSNNQLAVIAVFFKAGNKKNGALAELFSNLPARSDEEITLNTPFNAQDLLPDSLAYYTFSGSLTTPECTEGVSWYVLKQPVELSHTQIAAYQTLFKMTSRPVQPLNGRVVSTTE